MKRIFKTLIIFTAVATVGLGFWILTNKSNVKNTDSVDRTVQSPATLMVPVGDGGKTYDISPFIGKSVTDAMYGVGITFKKSGEGQNSFITSIENRNTDPNKREFWEFLVNNKQAEVGAGSYIIQPSDQIEWKIGNY